MEDKEFWMVYKEEGQSPTHKHYDEGQAIGEAERLSKQNIGVMFYIANIKYGYKATSYAEKIELIKQP